MDRQQFARMLRDTLVRASDLNLGDVVYSFMRGVEGEVVRFDNDGDPILRLSDGDSEYISTSSIVIRLFSAKDAIRVFLPTNSDKELLKSNESLSDVKGYVCVYVLEEEHLQRLFETHSERVHLITDLTVVGELPPVKKLKKKHRRTLALVSEHYEPGEATKTFFHSFMDEMK